MRSLRYTLVDVFTRVPLRGNALAVFTGAAGIGDATLLDIAREMNLSETVFVLPPAGEGQARLRIFTPRAELDFAGHPILGAAAVVGRTITVDVLVFETGAGPIAVALDREGAEVRSARLRAPLPEPVDPPDPAALAAALGATPVLPVEAFRCGSEHALVAVGTEAELRGLTPDLWLVGRLHRGTVVVYARSGAGFEARVFAPALGVAEDAATGSAAGPLALHAARHGWATTEEWVCIAQGEAIGRASALRARITGTADAPTQVEVEGDMVLIGRGELRLPISS